MKFQISLSSHFTKGDRVIVRIAKNEWYTGVVLGAGALLKIKFDDGATAEVDAEDLGDVHTLYAHIVSKAALADAQAKPCCVPSSTKPLPANLLPPRDPSSGAVLNIYGTIPGQIYAATKAGRITCKATPVSVQSLMIASRRESITLDDMKNPEFRISDVDSKRILQYVKLFQAGSVGPALYVIDIEGKRYVLDGSHRLLAAHLAGIKTLVGYKWELKDLMNTLWQSDKRRAPEPLIWSRR